jgi:hypothetical protein
MLAVKRPKPMKKISYFDTAEAISSHNTDETINDSSKGDDITCHSIIVTIIILLLNFSIDGLIFHDGMDLTISSTGTDSESYEVVESSHEANAAIYGDYWNYAAYYGENLARQYYGETASPPKGSKPPAGYIIPSFKDDSQYFVDALVTDPGSIEADNELVDANGMSYSNFSSQPQVYEEMATTTSNIITTPGLKRSESVDEDLLADYINRNFDVLV